MLLYEVDTMSRCITLDNIASLSIVNISVLIFVKASAMLDFQVSNAGS